MLVGFWYCQAPAKGFQSKIGTAFRGLKWGISIVRLIFLGLGRRVEDNIKPSVFSYANQAFHQHFYESRPVGLAEVIDASEASLGGPGGRAGKMCANRVK